MFQIITDNGADLSRAFLAQHNVGCMYLSTILDGKVIADANKYLAPADFYDLLQGGAKPTTAQINPDGAMAYFEAHIDEADEFLYIALSSGLSGTYGSVKIGAEETMEKHPGKKIEVVDSLNGSPGQGLLVYHAVTMRDQGMSLQEAAAKLRELAPHIQLAITVDNLFDLWRGGRVSRSSAVLGSLVAIKPFIIIDNKGSLKVVKKIRGRKKSLDYLAEYMDEKMGSYREANKQMIVVNNGNVQEDADYAVAEIKRRLGLENILQGNVGPMIGTHTGPSIVVVAFLGDERE